MRLLPCGDRALLAEFDSLVDAAGAHASWGMNAPEGVVELVPAARTVLVRFDPAMLGVGAIEHWLRTTTREESAVSGSRLRRRAASIPIPVHYDGEDLAIVASVWGCSLAEVAARHAAIEWVCVFSGFAPGFPYLVPATLLDDPNAPPPLRALPRRATSRERVPAGAVAVAAEYCGIYPRESPGGWQLIGRTTAPMWDADRQPPALLAPGDRVRFVAMDGAFPTELGRGGGGDRDRRGRDRGGRTLRVLEPGPLTLVQDLGRPGLAALGVGRSGAMDRAAHRLANRLVGNPEQAATLEVLLGGIALALPEGAWVAVTGGTGPIALDGRAVTARTAVRVERDGAELRLGALEHGLRAIVAVRGGVCSPAVLGSRARDTLAGLGPVPLVAGEEVPLGPEPVTPVPAIDFVPVDAPAGGTIELAVRPGPRRDWFAAEAWSALLTVEWTVSSRSDRTGVRLDGPALERDPSAESRELPSEGMLPGSIQVSPDGAPTVLGPDAPVTGGYPVIAVLTDAALDLLAQLRPGQPVRLRLATGRH